jgi:hypothetical protein
MPSPLVANRALIQLSRCAPGPTVAVLLAGYGEGKAVRFGNRPQELERKRTL